MTSLNLTIAFVPNSINTTYADTMYTKSDFIKSMIMNIIKLKSLFFLRYW